MNVFTVLFLELKPMENKYRLRSVGVSLKLLIKRGRGGENYWLIDVKFGRRNA